MRTIFILLTAAAAAATAQTVAVDKIGPFTIHQISERGKFDRCAATLNSGPGMLRIAWKVGSPYTVSVPSVPQGSGERVMLFKFGRKSVSYDATIDRDRTWAALDNAGADDLMALRNQIEIQLFSARYVWPIGAVKMEDVFVKLEDCAHSAGRANQSGGGAFRSSLQKVGAWEVARYTRDAAGKQLAYCTAMVITGQEQGLRVQFEKNQTIWGFMGNASAAIGPAPMVSYWFDNDVSSKRTVKMKLIKAPEDGSEWMTYSETADSPGDEDAYMNTQKVTFSYRFEGKPVTQVIPLRGANAALGKMIDTCPLR